MYCINCGKSVNETQQYCDSCGAKQNILTSLEEEKPQIIHVEKKTELPETARINLNLIKCPHCNKELAKTALTCPHCGGETEAKTKAVKAKTRKLMVLIIVFFLFSIFYILVKHINTVACINDPTTGVYGSKKSDC